MESPDDCPDCRTVSQRLTRIQTDGNLFAHLLWRGISNLRERRGLSHTQSANKAEIVTVIWFTSFGLLTYLTGFGVYLVSRMAG